MDQTVEQLEAHIGRTRDRLDASLRVLHDKIEEVTDWRAQLRSRPWLMVGAAFVGGVALAAALRPRASRTSDVRRSALADLRDSDTLGQVGGLLDSVMAALVGVAATKVRDYVGGVVPGFDEHFDEARQRRS